MRCVTRGRQSSNLSRVLDYISRKGISGKRELMKLPQFLAEQTVKMCYWWWNKKVTHAKRQTSLRLDNRSGKGWILSVVSYLNRIQCQELERRLRHFELNCLILILRLLSGVFLFFLWFHESLQGISLSCNLVFFFPHPSPFLPTQPLYSNITHHVRKERWKDGEKSRNHTLEFPSLIQLILLS